MFFDAPGELWHVTLRYREMAFSHQNDAERMFISLIMSRCFAAYHVDFSVHSHLPFNPVTQCSALSHRNLTSGFRQQLASNG